MIFLSAVVIICCKAAADGRGNLSGNNQEGQEAIQVELFVLAPCESCHEDDKFRQEVLSQLDKAGFENPDCVVYNVYKDSGAAHFEKITETYQLELTLTDLPAAVVDGTVYRGTYQEIGDAVARHLEAGVSGGQANSVSGSDKTAVNSGADVTNSGTDPESNALNSGSDPESSALNSGSDTEADLDEDTTQVTNTLADSAFNHELQTVGENDTTLVLFVTGSCESCQTAEAYLQNDLSNEKFDLLIYNILEDENALVLRRLFALYGVPDSGQQVPLLFSRKGYLSGAKAIVDGTEGMLADGDTAGSWEEIITSLSQEKENAKISKLQLLVTGFINGLNPCGISMLLMILSILLMSGRNFYGGSLVFLTGKFLTYLFLGFTIGTLLGVIEGTVFQTLQKGMKVVFSVLALFFGLFYLMDFIHVLRKEYGREKLRLPERFRKWNHTMIKKLTEIPERFWYPVLFLLGIVISAGEFLCTGQVYLASLLYMVKQNQGFDMQLAGNLVLYLTAMCVPMVLVVVLVSRGKSVMSASNLSLKMLPVVKLAYSIFFFILFLSLLF
ncbi:MAG: hypothetical protein HFH87_02450 [Lachnospiraceae bacterium]|nr:hypothetical protein [Lachnospiraceae bacterium]